MSQFLSQVPQTSLRQEQRMTAQLIQAMYILQLNAMALEGRIAQEIDANPALEYAPDEDAYTPETTRERETDRSEGEETLVVNEGDAAEFERLDNLVREYDWIEDDAEYRGTTSRERRYEESDSKLEAMANTASRPIGLQEYLLNQWHLVETTPRLREVGERIIDRLSDSGRLDLPLHEIQPLVDPPASAAEVEEALALVQQLDPPGIGAQNIRECLLLQLAAMPGDNWLETAIVREHLDDLRRNRLPQIAKALDVDLDDVKGALHVISRLALHPGDEVVERQAPAITPDVIVEYDEELDEYTVRLARANAQELRIAPEFKRALARARQDKAAREFVKQKLDSANAIIDALKYRKDRLLEVAEAVVAAQREFFDQGEQHIKVLRMSELAERFGCDPSTISRTVDEKYLQTPRGIFPLRRFFTGGAETSDGESLGWDSIRATVQEIIAAEDKQKPLSDDAIVKELKRRGIEIKRRTVAKYRSQLGIPTARQRREY